MRHILLVDDEPEILEGLVLILQPLQDVVLHTACLAAHALRMMDEQHISLVIADIRMPGMNGIEMWEEIRRHAPECRVIFLSGVRDFDHIYRVIQSPHARFLTKMEPEEKILSCVREALAELDAEDQQRIDGHLALLRDYLIADDHACSDMLLRLREQPKFSRMDQSEAFLFVTPAHRWGMTAHEQRQALLSFEETFRTFAGGTSRFILLGEASALCLLDLPDEYCTEQQFAAVLEKLCSQLNSCHRLQYRCCFGVTIPDAEQLREEYQAFRSWHTLENVPITQIRTVCSLTVDEMDTRLQAQLRTLEGYLALGQRENFMLLLNNLLGTIEYRHGNYLLAIHFGVLALLDQHLTQIRATKLQATLRQECVFLPETEASRQAAQNHLRSVCSEAFDLLFPPDAYAQQDVVQSVQQYIRGHLSDDLSLNALSRRFAIHPAYLSRIFSESAGQRLHDYISQLRLSHAAHLLLSTSKRVNAIAHDVGYDSVHTFIRAFRKQFNMTPADYRNQKNMPKD